MARFINCLGCGDQIDRKLDSYTRLEIYALGKREWVQFLCQTCVDADLFLTKCIHCGREFYITDEIAEMGEPKLCSEKCASSWSR